MREKKGRRKKKRYHKDDDKLETEELKRSALNRNPRFYIPSRKGFGRTYRGKGGGGRSKPSRYIKRHDFKYQPEPKYKPKPEKLTAPRGEYGWSDPKQPKPERVIIRNEPDAEELLKELEKNPELYERLTEKILERMDKDFRDQSEAMEVKDYGELPQEDSEKPVEKVEEIKDKPFREDELTESSHEISGSLFYDSMAGSVPRKGDEAQSENVEPEEREDILEDRYLEDEAKSLREREAEQDSAIPEPSADVIEHLENQDLSELEAEIFPPESEPEKEIELAEKESALPEPYLPETEPLSEIVETEEEEAEEQGY